MEVRGFFIAVAYSIALIFTASSTGAAQGSEGNETSVVPLPAFKHAFFDNVIDDPVAAASGAAARGDFRFVYIHNGWSVTLPGVHCFLREKRESIADQIIVVGDVLVPVPDDSPWYEAGLTWNDLIEEAAKSYNLTLLQSKQFPDRDVCWRQRKEWIGLSPEDDTFLKALASPLLATPALDLVRQFSQLSDVAANQYEKTDIVTAARFGDIAAVTRYLLDGASSNAVRKWGLSALDWAIVRNNAGLVEELISAGAKPFEVRGDKGWNNFDLDLSLRRFASQELRWAVVVQNEEILSTLLTKLYTKVPVCLGMRGAFNGIQFSVLADWLDGVKVIHKWTEGFASCEQYEFWRSRVIEIAERKDRQEIANWMRENFK